MKNSTRPRIMYGKFKKVCLLFTGGTIAMAKKSDDSLAPAHSAKSLISIVPDIKKVADLDYEFVANIDSTNMHPGIWTKLAEKIYNKYHQYDGFIVTHGTDTMAFTASALSFAFRNLSKPIVLTGAQKPFTDLASDAQNNLLNAVTVATMEVPEVCIVFGNEILRGNRAKKRSESKLNAFFSPVVPAIGSIALAPEINSKKRAPKNKKIIFQPDFENNIVCYRIFPGLEKKYLEIAINNGCKGIVLDSYGAGNVPNKTHSLLPIIKKAVEKNIPVVITTQCIEGSAQMFIYEVGYAALKAGAISAQDMTSEAATVKLMWALAQTKSLSRIRKIMATNIAGEISAERKGF